jgi:hypothetical protein
LLGVLEIVVSRPSVVCVIFAEYVKDLTAIIHTCSSALELKKLAVGARLYRNYNLDSTICFDVRVSWKIGTRALFFIDKVAIPHSTVIPSIKNLHNSFICMNGSNIRPKKIDYCTLFC